MPLMSEKQKEIIVTDGSDSRKAYSKEAKFVTPILQKFPKSYTREL